METLEIGTKFTYGKIKLEVVKSERKQDLNPCSCCYFDHFNNFKPNLDCLDRDKKITGECCRGKRSDKTDTWYKQIQK